MVRSTFHIIRRKRISGRADRKEYKMNPLDELSKMTHAEQMQRLTVMDSGLRQLQIQMTIFRESIVNKGMPSFIAFQHAECNVDYALHAVDLLRKNLQDEHEGTLFILELEQEAEARRSNPKRRKTQKAIKSART